MAHDVVDKEKALKIAQNAVRMNGGCHTPEDEQTDRLIFKMIAALCSLCIGITVVWCAFQYF